MLNKPITDLINVLQEVHALLNKSDKIPWDASNPEKASTSIQIAIAQLTSKQKVDKNHLKLLFAPTGCLQECSMANNWETEYLNLSKKFDELMDAIT